MAATEQLRVGYTITADLIQVITDVLGTISLEFELWDEQYVQGPNLYFVVVLGTDTGRYADPLGDNQWPVDIARVVTEDFDAFREAALEVAFECDGVVVVSADGTIKRQMVRITSPNGDSIERRQAFEFADWMGTKHLSAVETSAREEVLAAVTLSEEDGRVTVFRDGSYEDARREELGGPWRPAE